jgi:hypothetical protein
MCPESAQPCASPSTSWEFQPLRIASFLVVRRQRVAQCEHILRRQHRVAISVHDEQGRAVACDVSRALNSIGPSCQLARVLGPPVLLFGCALVGLHGCAKAGGCVDDHGRPYRHLLLGEGDQRRSSAGREAEQAHLIPGAEATELLQRCDD